jgi:adenosylcobinamide-GDP ribazoletransferase
MTTGRDALAARPGIAPLAEVRAAVAFLTRLPIRRESADIDRTGAAAFALVGAAIGVVGAVPLVVLGPRLPWPAAVVALVVIVVVSGGLHLDGLGDTADALAAPTPEAAERARTDPRAGVAGVAAIVLDLLLGTSLLAAITAAGPQLAAAALVVAATASRAAAPVAAWVELWRTQRGPTEREPTHAHAGIGGWFSTRVGPGGVVAVVATTALVSALAAVVGGVGVVLLGVAAGLAVAAVCSTAVIARRGQLDGDGYGAIVEITFVAILAGVAIQLPPTLP